jgi:cytochrome c biogenesis protein CcmG/thiol:disulfide interchange protein DsbE
MGEERRRRLAYRVTSILALALPIAGILLVVTAIQEYRSRGTQGVSGISIANYRAVAKADDRPAPGFRLPSLDGDGQISLQDYADRVVVLNFWASWCIPCRQEAPHLQAIWEEYRGGGVQVLGVNYRDDRAAAMAYEREFGITFPSVFDPAGKLAFDYELIGVPTTFLIRPDGRMAYRFTGKIDAEILEDALSGVLEGEP